MGPDSTGPAASHHQVVAFHCVLVKIMIGPVRKKEKKG